jgi:hypothetical protein
VASFSQCYLGRGQARARLRFLLRPWSSLPWGMQSYKERLVQLIHGELLLGQLSKAELGRGGVFSEAEADFGRDGVLFRG